MSQTPPDPSQSGPQVALPGAKAAMALLLGINLFNYIDRQVLSAVVPQIKESLLAHQDHASPVVAFLLKVLGTMLGGNAENTMVSLLSMAFLVSYIIAAPLLSSLPVKRWWIICGGVIIWSLASGGSGMATGFGILLLTRCLVGIGEAAYGPVAPSILADYFPVASRGKALSWFLPGDSGGQCSRFCPGRTGGQHAWLAVGVLCGGAARHHSGPAMSFDERPTGPTEAEPGSRAVAHDTVPRLSQEPLVCAQYSGHDADDFCHRRYGFLDAHLHP
jgi:MFS family permease